MAFLYVVRCNFARPEREAAWNDWYSGPKLRQMLAKPLFRSGQRFVATALDMRRKYLALWLVESPAAFATPEYRADWGFGEWAADVTDWSRDLYDASAAADGLFDIGTGEAVYLASFDGMSQAEAQHLPQLVWLEAVGLDRRAPVIGLRKVAPSWRPVAPIAAPGLSATVFTPITARLRPQPSLRTPAR